MDFDTVMIVTAMSSKSWVKLDSEFNAKKACSLPHQTIFLVSKNLLIILVHQKAQFQDLRYGYERAQGL